MKILFLAPEPFFQERGTPIAVRLALEVLAKRGDDQVDLLTYHEGEQVSIPNVNIHRINAPKWLSGVGPGISFKKILCDIIFTITALKMVLQGRKAQYQLVHAVEESVYIAFLLRLLFGIPYIYDMDSSLALQLTEKWYLLRPFRFILEFLESVAIKYSLAVVPVCDALAAIAERHGASDTQILRDISLLDVEGYDQEARDLRTELSISPESCIAVYIGNLEQYQGIDLLLEGFAEIAANVSSSHIVVIGGRQRHIEQYMQKVEQAGLSGRMHFVGPRPVASLSAYLQQADILVSPRTKGNNTPMKIYSYLHSGKAIIATDLPTHTQVLDQNVALLVKPEPQNFGAALQRLFEDKELRSKIGDAAYQLAVEKYTFDVFSQRLNDLYDRVQQKV